MRTGELVFRELLLEYSGDEEFTSTFQKELNTGRWLLICRY